MKLNARHGRPRLLLPPRLIEKSLRGRGVIHTFQSGLEYLRKGQCADMNDRLFLWGKGIPQGPYYLLLFPTNVCNLSCRSCWKQACDMNDKIPFERLIKIPKEAAEIGVKYCEISGGGEPTTRLDDIIKLLKEFKKHGIITHMRTNGTLLTEDSIKEIVEGELLGGIIFSVDGPNAEVNDYLRGRGTFRKLRRNMLLFRDYKRRLKKVWPHVQIYTVISNRNYSRMSELVEFSKDVGCDFGKAGGLDICICAINVHSPMGEELVLSKKQKKVFVEKLPSALNLAEFYGINTNFRVLMSGSLIENTNSMENLILPNGKPDCESGPLCLEPWFRMWILAAGNIAICCESPVYDCDNTSISNHTLKELWSGRFMTKVRQDLQNGKLFPHCFKCSAPTFSINRKIMEALKNY